MAARYWVLGNGTWDATTTTHWSATSGGAGGASVPTAVDNVILDSNAASAVITTLGAIVCGALDCSGLGFPFTGTIAGAGTLTVNGNVTISAGTTLTWSGNLIVNATASIAMNGITLPAFITIVNGVTLTSTFTTTVSHANGIFFNGSATLAWGNNNVMVNTPKIDGAGATNVLTMNTFSNASLKLTGTGTVFSGTVFSTISAGATSLILITNTSNVAVTFSGNGKTYNDIFFERGISTGSNIISGSNTFNLLKDLGTEAHSLIFDVGTTQTVSNFQVNGSATKLITINSSTTATHSLVKTGGGTITCNYLNIQHSVATPANTWYATNSIDNQSVPTAGSGWNFTAPASNSGNMFALF